MRITNVQKGVKGIYPLTVEGKWIGWTQREYPDDGLLVIVEPGDGTGFLLTDDKLKELGFVSTKIVEDALDTE